MGVVLTTYILIGMILQVPHLTPPCVTHQLELPIKSMLCVMAFNRPTKNMAQEQCWKNPWNVTFRSVTNGDPYVMAYETIPEYNWVGCHLLYITQPTQGGFGHYSHDIWSSVHLNDPQYPTANPFFKGWIRVIGDFPHLVGGWTNQSEKYAQVKLDHLPR